MPSLPSLDFCKKGESVSKTEVLVSLSNADISSVDTKSSYLLPATSILPARIKNKCVKFLCFLLRLQCDASEAPGQLSHIKEDVQFAACDLVCEWAQKVLKRQFDAVEDLARFLIDSHYISNKSLAALTITASTASGTNQWKQRGGAI